MELAGDEKRIQALFSELSFQERSCAPPFERVWPKTENAGPSPVRILTPALAIATAVIIAAASFLVASMSYRSTQSSTQQAVLVEPPTISTPVVQKVSGLAVAVGGVRSTYRPRQKRPGRVHQSERTLMRNAALLASWQSPTQRFVESPTTSVWSALPQLNQSAQELKLFLPKNNELTKESNQ